MTSSTSTRRRRAGRRAGYTMIEVMMAVGVLTAGAVGLLALQQAATRGNYEARQMTTGAQLAQRWVERIRRDAINWRASSTNADPTLLMRTTYLQNVTAPGDAPAWFVPTPVAGSGESATFDHYGADVIDASQTPTYCTNVRLAWLYRGRAIRADVRVWWLRRSVGTSADPDSTGRAALANCAPGRDPNTLLNDWRVRAAHASTVIRYMPPPAVD